VETLKRVDRPTPISTKSVFRACRKAANFFSGLRLATSDPAAQEASKDGLSVTKAPLAAALRLALNTYSLLQRGEPSADPRRQTRRRGDADLVKAKRCTFWAQISQGFPERSLGVVFAPTGRHGNARGAPLAVSVMIDQGYETMEGASGDDWISSAQSMRTYMRAGLICGVVGIIYGGSVFRHGAFRRRQ